MGKTIRFKPEFEKKLKKLKIKTKFVANFKNQRWFYMSDITLEEANSAKTWEFFIYYSFNIHESPEGTLFWIKIAQL